MQLVFEVYKLTNNFPQLEKFGLISQIRRSVVSIPSNIAEGHGRKSDKELVRFLNIARGSIYELDTQIEIAKQLNYLSQHEFDCLSSLLDETSRLLYGLHKAKSQYSNLSTQNQKNYRKQ